MKRLLLLLLLALPAFSQHAWWQLNVTQGNPNISIAEWKFFDVSTAQIATTGGTPLASSTAAGSASNAFDGSSATFWASSGAVCTLQYHFATAVDPTSFTIQTRSDAGSQVPYDLAVRYSDDGSAWSNFYLYFGIPWTNTNGQTITLDSAHSAPAVSTGISWRISITADAAGQKPSLAELTFYDASGTAYTTTAYAAITSSTNDLNPGYLAFDGSLTSFFAANAVPSGGSPQTIGYRFSSPSVAPATFSITARNITPSSATPSAFSLQYSTDESTWTTVRSYTSASWTTSNQVQTFGGVQTARHRVNTE